MMKWRKEVVMANSRKDLVQVKAVSMYPAHWAIVDEFAQHQGYGSKSAALRRIIDEWNQIRMSRAQVSEGITSQESPSGGPSC